MPLFKGLEVPAVKRRSHDGVVLRRIMVTRDTDVIQTGDSLHGRHVLLGITGGIAAVESVKLARELRRHGAELTVVMTPSAQRIITPLAVRWASQAEVITDWDGDLSVLNSVDAVLVAPATRDVMASHIHGLQHGPLMMALSVARSRTVPVLMIPSMHQDLATDPVTDEIVEELRQQSVHVLWGPDEEGKRKTPSPRIVVAHLCHHLNKRLPKRRHVVVTLGATRSPIDDVRFVQNTSTGATGWAIADHLHRHGHNVTCVAGLTTAVEPEWLPLVLRTPTPQAMLAECLALANDPIDAWIHAAAVLDYVVGQPAEGKLASQQGPLAVELVEHEKHIQALESACQHAVRIGFKLESGIKQNDLIHRAVAQIGQANMTAVVANRLEDIGVTGKPRGYLVDRQGAHFVLEDQARLNDALLTLVQRGPEGSN
ncbi:MAG: bifunctional phosphopantothenoylcysteine decarboxylase/phosphopantothenate--cysteine ligase CoaBC [Candidatus Poseidoniales archaeon]|nr:MAG: bifunctional phosphopantothenoylcysteine decarboxylase/phosphopantothenate--cysteine ligase CoaBC [Candidatus Poseidoniales archaeon]